MRIERIWSMPNRWTFQMPHVRNLLKEEMNGGLWCDPFAGMNSPAQVRNDLNPDARADFHMDALEFLQSRADEEFDGVLFDPPYSFRQASECYKDFGREQHSGDVTSMDYWASVKREISRITKPNGQAICFGWNTNGIAMERGFELYRILIVAHGGGQNDTLITCERKVVSQIKLFEHRK